MFRRSLINEESIYIFADFLSLLPLSVYRALCVFLEGDMMKFWFQGSYTAFIFIYLFIFLSWFLIVSKYCQKESPAEDWSQGLHPKKRDKRWLQIVHFIQFWTESGVYISLLSLEEGLFSNLDQKCEVWSSWHQHIYCKPESRPTQTVMNSNYELIL